jgi:hypothetical protein
MKLLAALCFAVIALSIGLGQSSPPRTGYVPDEVTAVKIAEAVLVPIYGEQHIISERPFTAELDGDVWTVTGTLHCGNQYSSPTVRCVGGVAEIKISAVDARILSVKHGK